MPVLILLAAASLSPSTSSGPSPGRNISAVETASDVDTALLTDALLPLKTLRAVMLDGCTRRLSANLVEAKAVEAAIPGITAFMLSAAKRQCTTDFDQFVADDTKAIRSFITGSMTPADRHRLAMTLRKAVAETNSFDLDAVPPDDPDRVRTAMRAVHADYADLDRRQHELAKTRGGARLINMFARYQDAHNKILEQLGEKIMLRAYQNALSNGNRFAQGRGFASPFTRQEQIASEALNVKDPPAAH